MEGEKKRKKECKYRDEKAITAFPFPSPLS